MTELDYLTEIKELKLQIETYPIGYISRKKINGKIRYYHQWVEQGKIKSKYLREDEASELIQKIAERKLLQDRIKEYYAKISALSTETAPSKKPMLFWYYDFKSYVGSNCNKLLNAFSCKRVPELERFIKEDSLRHITPYIVYDDKAEMIVGYFTLATSCMVLVDKIYDTQKHEIQVDSMLPCVEIEHFCVNDKYIEYKKNNNEDIHGVGTFIFNNYIIDALCELRTRVNFQFVTLHALGIEKVIEAYRGMGFYTFNEDAENTVPIMNDVKAFYNFYTENCVFMIQDIEDIQMRLISQEMR